MDRSGLIFITGFMASGKSTVGPRVAQVLGVHFIDLDDEIAIRAGRRIPEIFSDGGEPLFRAHERETLSALVHDVRSGVIAVGGGALASDAGMELAKRAGTVVFLRADAVELASRLRGVVDRPMLHAEDGAPLAPDALAMRIERLLSERMPHYEQAHVTVDTSGKDIDEVVAEVVDRLATLRQREDQA